MNWAAEKARIAIALDAHDTICYLADARVNSLLGRHEIAIGRPEEAVRLNPSSSMTHYGLGFVLEYVVHSEDAIPHIERAVSLGPRGIFLPGYLGFGSAMLFSLERFDEALDWARRGCNNVNPKPPNFTLMAACLVLFDWQEEAKAVVEDMQVRFNFRSIRDINRFLKRSNMFGRTAAESLIETLRQAGLPE
ncbi:MAG: hypothetical protein OSB69_00045 [Alphaproteobacteria bacterium]|nr:hypothetical protein [Alphaproteobacteria bacterium]